MTEEPVPAREPALRPAWSEPVLVRLRSTQAIELGSDPGFDGEGDASAS